MCILLTQAVEVQVRKLYLLGCDPIKKIYWMLQLSIVSKLQSQADFKGRVDVKKYLTRTQLHKENKRDWLVPWSPFPEVPPIQSAAQKMCQKLNSEGKISDRSQKSHCTECSLGSPFGSSRNSTWKQLQLSLESTLSTCKTQVSRCIVLQLFPSTWLFWVQWKGMF